MNIENFEKTMNLLNATGLNWEVRKEQFAHANGQPTPFYGIFRYDDDKANPTECLGSVKERYTPFQNFDMADTVIRATESIGISTNRGGQLDGGKKVYLQAKLDDEYVGKSAVKRYVTCLNSHDGSSAIGFGSSNTVVVCQNTFHRAYGDVQKFRHTVSAQQRIDTAIADFRTAIGKDEKLFETFKRMSEIQTNENVVKAVLNNMFKVDMDKGKKDDISTRKSNQMHRFAQAYNIERDLEGDTLWGLFNAVTRYTNHMESPANADRKNSYLMAGTGYKINNTAYDTIMAWIEENTASTEKYHIFA